MRKYAIGVFAAVSAILALAVGSYAFAGSGKTNLKSDALTGYQEATPAGVSTLAGGSFELTIDDEAMTISYELRYSGLSTPATQAHIHFGNRFDSGGVSTFLCAGDKPACPPGTTTEAVVTGTITPANIIGPTTQGIAPGEFDELVRALRVGVTYANVHSANFPQGEIRGQINDDNQRQP
jgi:CHRD domain-containing protein